MVISGRLIVHAPVGYRFVLSQTEVDGSLTIIDNFDKTEKMRKEKNSHRRDAGNFDSKVSSLMYVRHDSYYYS